MMFALSELVAPLAAELRGDDLRFAEVTTDSRGIANDALFVALKGDRFDGHSFVAQAHAAGAVAALVSEFVDVALPQVKVADTLAALQQMAAQWRSRFGIPVVARSEEHTSELQSLMRLSYAVLFLKKQKIDMI